MKEPSAGAQKSSRTISPAHMKRLRERASGRAKRMREPPLTAQARHGEVALSYAQERLWFLEQLGLVGCAYNTQTVFKLEGSLDVAALQASFEELIRRHEILRTRFESRNGTPVQIVEPQLPFTMDVADLCALEEDFRGLRVQELIRKAAQDPFDLTRGPLLRATLLNLGRDEHVLVLTVHHIVIDGWSWGVLNREVSTLYGAFCAGAVSPLPELPIQYADYATWQRRWLSGEVLQERLRCWVERLSDAPAELQLPLDRPRGAVASFKGARVSVRVDAALHAALDELSRYEGVTLFMTMLAAYQVLLARYCGQEDVVVGSPIAGRSHAQTEGLIGFFVNTLALRTDLSGNPTFRQLLQRVKETTLDAYAHQEVPFERLVMELQPERNLTRQPIFQVALALQNYPQQQLALPGLTWTRMETERVTSMFDLAMHLFERADGLHGVLVYATDLFDRETIERMASHFLVLLQGIVANPDRPIQQLPLLTPAARRQVLTAFNDTAVACLEDRLVHELFEEWAERTPGAVAIFFENECLTYAELNSRANRLAQFLREQGVRTGDNIPIVMDRCPQLIIAQLAVLKRGGAYVPIDPLLPQDRLAFVIADCGARCIVTGPGAPQTSLLPQRIQQIDCSQILAARAEACANDESPDPVRHRAAYVMYTSGSTGVPKGVVVAHRGINRLVINCNYAHVEPTDRLAHCSNPAFDASTFEIWGALLNGASVVIVPQCVLLEPMRFAQSLQQYRVTVLFLTVGLFTQYADVLTAAFGRLRYLLTGGDVVEPAVVRRVLRNCAPQHLLNAYGPTECTTFATTHRIDTLEEDAKSVPIGRPISNTQIYVLDDHLQPAPIGVAGEIYIGGKGVAIGYLNRPELTEQRFVPDPFSSEADARMYKSGDLGRWRPDGTIEFLGRNDQQVKLRGFRIELGEIEAQLARHCQVREAVVVAREAAPGSKHLIAYVTARDENPRLTEELHSQLESVLPPYMIPSAFVILDRFPLTPNGKVDRRALPAPTVEAYARERYEAPIGDTENRLAAIWRTLLKLESVGRRDNFFSLGGHSLLVLQALFEINRAFDCALTVKDVYRSPTLLELAARIGGQSLDDDFVDLVREAALDAGVTPLPASDGDLAGAVLLTGGTGFVGRFLLAQLLHETGATVYCLVRAASPHQAMSRLRSTLQTWDLWHEAFQSRVIAICGDLRRPHLGIDEPTYQRLARNADAIYHCATSMNHLETYAAAKPANVGSAHELIKLAATGKGKLINYISTVSVFAPGTAGLNRVVDETSPIDTEKHSTANGYAASKWVAEKIFTAAAASGIRCNIFRLGLVWADTQRGRYDELQREYRILKTCLMTGRGIVNYRYAMPPTPIDCVARAIVSLADSHRRGGGVFHIASPYQQTEGLFERLNARVGTALELMPYYDWICHIKELHGHGISLPAVPLLEFAFSLDRDAFDERQRRVAATRVRIDCAQTHRELEQLGIVMPGLDDDSLRLCLESMCSRDDQLAALEPSEVGLSFLESPATAIGWPNGVRV